MKFWKEMSTKAKRWTIAVVAAIVILLGIGFGYYKTVPGTNIPVPQDSIALIADTLNVDSVATDTIVIDAVVKK